MTQWQRRLARGLCKIMSMHSARALEELTEAKCFLKRFERQSRWRGNTPRFPGPTQICFLGTTVSGSGNCMNRKKLMPSMSANGPQMSTRVRGKMRFFVRTKKMFGWVFRTQHGGVVFQQNPALEVVGFFFQHLFLIGSFMSFTPFFHSKGFTNLIPRTSQDSKKSWRLLPTFRSGKQKRGNLYKVTSPPQGKQGPANSTNGGLHSPLIAGLSPPKTPKTGEKMVPIGEGVSENGAFGGQICNAKKLFFLLGSFSICFMDASIVMWTMDPLFSLPFLFRLEVVCSIK